MDRKRIGEKIKKMRNGRDWAQYKLATLAGVSPSYIREIENGLKCPTVEVLDAICFAFGITLADFFTERGENELYDKLSTLTEKQKTLLNEFLNSL